MGLLGKLRKEAVDKNYPTSNKSDFDVMADASRKSTEHFMKQKQPETAPFIEPEAEVMETEDKPPEVSAAVRNQRQSKDTLTGLTEEEEREKAEAEWDAEQRAKAEPHSGPEELEAADAADEAEANQLTFEAAEAAYAKHKDVQVYPNDILSWAETKAIEGGIIPQKIKGLLAGVAQGFGETIPMSEVPAIIEQVRELDPLHGPVLADELQRSWEKYMYTEDVDAQLPAPFRPLSQGVIPGVEKLGKYAYKLIPTLEAIGIINPLGLPSLDLLGGDKRYTQTGSVHTKQMARRGQDLVNALTEAESMGEDSSAARKALVEFESKFGRKFTRDSEGQLRSSFKERGESDAS